MLITLGLVKRCLSKPPRSQAGADKRMEFLLRNETQAPIIALVTSIYRSITCIV
jgi:hypothetical protein